MSEKPRSALLAEAIEAADVLRERLVAAGGSGSDVSIREVERLREGLRFEKQSLEQRVFASMPKDSPMRKALEAVPVEVKDDKPQKLLVASGLTKCHACAHSYMEPSGPARLVCGHPDAGTMGMWADVASGTGIAAHCGPERPKFKQHELRNEDGSLKGVPRG